MASNNGWEGLLDQYQECALIIARNEPGHASTTASRFIDPNRSAINGTKGWEGLLDQYQECALIISENNDPDLAALTESGCINPKRLRSSFGEVANESTATTLFGSPERDTVLPAGSGSDSPCTPHLFGSSTFSNYRSSASPERTEIDADDLSHFLVVSTSQSPIQDIFELNIDQNKPRLACFSTVQNNGLPKEMDIIPESKKSCLRIAKAEEVDEHSIVISHFSPAKSVEE